MVTDVSQDIYQKKVMDHSRSPRNFRTLDGATHKATGFNRLCGDRVEIFLKLNDESYVEEASFQGESCAICKASASMLTDMVVGKQEEKVKHILARLQQFSENWTAGEEIGDFLAFGLMQEYPTRLKCLRLPWRTTAAALLAESKPVSTEGSRL